MAIQADRRTVSLTVPAKAEYLVLARLALAAVCRLTGLDAEQVSDLKLAITEAATGVLGDGPAEETALDRLGFSFELEDDRLLLEVRGAVHPVVTVQEQQLGRAIVEATVDEYDDAGGGIRLVKYLRAAEG